MALLWGIDKLLALEVALIFKVVTNIWGVMIPAMMTMFNNRDKSGIDNSDNVINLLHKHYWLDTDNLHCMPGVFILDFMSVSWQ